MLNMSFYYTEENMYKSSNHSDLLVFLTSSKASNMSMIGWWMVYTIILPVSTVFLTVLITIAAALASNPEVGSSMKSMEGLATNSTAIVSLLHCSVERPFTPGNPTNACLNGFSSTSSITSSTNTCNHFSFLKNSRTSWWNIQSACIWLKLFTIQRCLTVK